MIIQSGKHTYCSTPADVAVCLVAEHHEGEVVWIARAGLYQMKGGRSHADCPKRHCQQTLLQQKLCQQTQHTGTCIKNSSRQLSRLSNVFCEFTSYTRTQQSAPR